MGILLPIGAANQVYMTMINVVLQLNLPDVFRGRVMGVWGLTWSLQPLGGTNRRSGRGTHRGAFAIAIGGVLVTLMAFAVIARPSVRTL